MNENDDVDLSRDEVKRLIDIAERNGFKSIVAFEILKICIGVSPGEIRNSLHHDYGYLGRIHGRNGYEVDLNADEDGQ